MTPTISPVTGALPQQPAPTTTTCATPPPTLAAPAAPATAPTAQSQQAALGASPMTTTPPATTLGGGTVQAAQGAMTMAPEQLVPVLQQLVEVLTQLVAALQQQQQGAVVGGGAPGQVGQVGQCGMSGCTMGHSGGVAGAMGAPTAESPPADAPAPSGVDPANVRDQTSATGLEPAARRGLEEAHRFGLPLVSGKRSGGGGSDHDHGDAIDVANVPIGVASSDRATPEMAAFADHMRLQGRAGQLGVKYVISDGRIASSTNDWEWRPYTYPGKSQAELDALKQSNRGEYNRLQHFDHVHVSFT